MAILVGDCCHSRCLSQGDSFRNWQVGTECSWYPDEASRPVGARVLLSTIYAAPMRQSSTPLGRWLRIRRLWGEADHSSDLGHVRRTHPAMSPASPTVYSLARTSYVQRNPRRLPFSLPDRERHFPSSQEHRDRASSLKPCPRSEPVGPKRTMRSLLAITSVWGRVSRFALGASDSKAQWEWR